MYLHASLPVARRRDGPVNHELRSGKRSIRKGRHVIGLRLGGLRQRSTVITGWKRYQADGQADAKKRTVHRIS